MSTRKNIKTTNIELTPEISDYLDKRLESVEKLIDKDDTSVIFDIEMGQTTNHHQAGNIFRAEINLHVAGKQLRAVEEDETLFNAIDSARNEMVRELRKTKNKRIRLMRKGGSALKAFMHSIGSGGERLRDFARHRRK